MSILPTPADVLSEPPTIRDIALRAGVGIATVSRVVNRSPLVTRETQERVRRVMEEMGYAPGGVSRRRSRSRKLRGAHGAVCLLFAGHPTLNWMINSAPIYAYAIQGAEAALNARGLHCIIRHLPEPVDVSRLTGIPVDGFVVLSGGDLNDWPDKLKAVPRVKMLGLAGSGWSDCVTYNPDGVGALAASHLASLGVRRVAVIGDDSTAVFRRRSQAFCEHFSMVDLGHAENLSRPGMIRSGVDMHEANRDVVAAAINALLALPERPAGIFVTADIVVPEVYRQLTARGVRPGIDIHVISCNNERPYLAALSPRPAVVDIRAEAIGREAVERLMWRMNNPDAPNLSLLLDPVLVPPGPA
ncbi:MAG: LacI family DNA-binding transcriptional regulator [Verrucomicrobiota bacterium]